MPHSIFIDSLCFCATKSFNVTDVNLYGWLAPTVQGIWGYDEHTESSSEAVL